MSFLLKWKFSEYLLFKITESVILKYSKDTFLSPALVPLFCGPKSDDLSSRLQHVNIMLL